MVEQDMQLASKPRSVANPGVRRLLVVVGLWALVLGGIQFYAWQHMLLPLDLLKQLIELCRTSPFGWLLFVGAAALSPLLLIPAALLGSIAGMCFGLVPGVLMTLLGCNLSATLTYGLGRLTGHGHGRVAELVERYRGHVQRNGFIGVIVLRLSFLPYDPINYLIGLMRVPWPTFLLANTLGSLPGVIAIVLAGSSIQGLEHGLPMFNPLVLLGAIVMLITCLGCAAGLRRWAHPAER